MKVPCCPRRAKADRDDVRPVSIVLPHLRMVSLGFAPLDGLEALSSVPLLPEALRSSATHFRSLLERIESLLGKLRLELHLVAFLFLDFDLFLFFLLCGLFLRALAFLAGLFLLLHL